MKSMTGFAKVETENEGIKVTVEIKSFNGRFLEINCKLPKSLSHKEQEVRNYVKQYIARGNVFVQVNVQYDPKYKPFTLNEEMAVSIFEALKRLSKRLKIQSKITITDLLAFPTYLLTNTEYSTEDEIEWKLTEETLIKALREVDNFRLNEGKNLLNDIKRRVTKLSKLLQSIEKYSVDNFEKTREKLRQKVAQLFENDEIDENRLQMEILLLANKLDISEECTRLFSHIQFFKQTLQLREPIGQKLNFIVQEINREYNTISSKSDNVQISKWVVEAKEELERIREQIQNIE